MDSTEACIDTTFWTCKGGINQQNLPIGHPISNTEIYILDDNLQPVPIGVPGELHIGGSGLARGYLNRPELTAQKFIANPFKNSKFDRLYKTGDLARYNRDGSIEFLGRFDHLVKVRGFRIELAEIEAVLNQHPDVFNAVTIADVDAFFSKRLVAYIIPNQSQVPSANLLRQFLKQKLPDYMVPAYFVMLDTLPLTPNGKVDRKALVALSLSQNIGSEKKIPPRTSLEHKLLEIWSGILQISSIGVTENFFDLGGHSLLAIRLIATIEKQLGYSLSVVSLFREPTVEKIAALLEQDRKPNDLDILVPLQPKGDLLPLFLVHQAGGYALSYSVLAENLSKERPIYAIQAQGLNGKQPPLETIEAMATSYVKAIKEIQGSGSYLLGGHSLGGLIAFEMARQLEAAKEQVENLIIIDTHPPLPTPEIEASLSDNAAILCFIVEQIAIHFNTTVNISYEKLSGLHQEAQFQYVLQILQQSELIPPELGTNLIAGLLNVYKTNVRASLVYQPQPVKSPISLFVTASLAAQFPNDSTVGWQQLTSSKVGVCSLTGEHQTVLKEPSVHNLADAISRFV